MRSEEIHAFCCNMQSEIVSIQCWDEECTGLYILKDFPQPPRCPSGHLSGLGKYLGCLGCITQYIPPPVHGYNLRLHVTLTNGKKDDDDYYNDDEEWHSARGRLSIWRWPIPFFSRPPACYAPLIDPSSSSFYLNGYLDSKHRESTPKNSPLPSLKPKTLAASLPFRAELSFDWDKGNI